MTIQSTQQNQQMHVHELYSSPTCFNCCCGHHQGN